MTRNEQRKLEFMQRWVTGRQYDWVAGHYWSEIIGGELVVAEYEQFDDPDSGTHLGRYPIADLIAWYDRAVELRKAWNKEKYRHELHDVMFETETEDVCA
jgi:hypothetical protein